MAIRGNPAAVRHCQCWTDRIADSRRLTAYSDCCDQTAWSHDVDDAGEIIGEHVQCHLGNLRAWIADPSHTVPGTLMPHVSLSDPAEQLYVIAYLKTLSGKAAR